MYFILLFKLSTIYNKIIVDGILKRLIEHSCPEPIYSGSGTRAWSPLGSEAALREAASLPLARWRAPAIIAWLELALGMPQYAAAVADNVKSGKVSNTICYSTYA